MRQPTAAPAVRSGDVALVRIQYPQVLPNWATALYFSAETYTSLGYGDVVPTGPLRTLAGVEALNGLLLIGWSASFTYVAMQRFWGDARAPRKQEEEKEE